jgi:hypothetical protein
VTDLREPYFSYEELVEMVTDGYRVDDLPALEAAACDPGEQLWLAERGDEVYRVWRRGKGDRARWRLDFEPALETEARLSRKLEGSVLARLRAAHSCREYALNPGLAEDDLEVLHELERVWLAGARNPRYLPPDDKPLHALRLIQDRIEGLEGELARATALLGLVLTAGWGGDPEDDPGDDAAVSLVEAGQERDALADRVEYHKWVRSGGAASREKFPVRTPAGPTGLPDDVAARLMTAACETETVLPGRPYPRALPPGLAPWHVYIEGLGHSIAVAVEGVYEPGGDPWQYMTVAPVPMVLSGNWVMRDGLVLADVPYHKVIGAVLFDDADLEL